MFHDKHKAWDVVCQFVGQRISSLYRMYSCNAWTGEIQIENQEPLQINFANGQTLLLDGGMTGQDFKATTTPWQDPFAGEPQKLQVWLGETKGWWVRFFDVSQDAEYQDAIGSVIQAAYPIRTDNYWLSGVQFILGDASSMSFTYSADYCEVWWGNDHAQDFAERFLVVDDEYGCEANDQAQEQ